MPRPRTLRARLTLWYVSVLAILLLVYAALVFAFQYAALTTQLFHDEVQDVVTVEGLLYFDSDGSLQLKQDYYSRPQSHLLIDRLMEVRDLSGNILYSSPTLAGLPLGGAVRKGEGDAGFNERIVELNDGTHVFLVSHIHTMQNRTLLIRLGYSLAPLRARMLQFLGLLLIAIPVALVLAGIAGQLIAGRALRPLERMTDRAEGITARNLHDRLEIGNTDDELGHMGQVFNGLLDRLEEAFVQLQRFTADAAHELRTPIAALRTIGEVALEEGEHTEQYREALGSILEETARLNETIDGLLLLAKAEAMQPGANQTVFSLTGLVDEILELLAVLMEEKNIQVATEGSSSQRMEVRADRSLLRVAFLNVIHNSLKFSPQDSWLRISYESSAPLPSHISLAIEDQGPGIPALDRDRVFERFFTSKSNKTSLNSGSGLGLSIAKLIIERAGGVIKLDDSVSTGTRCIIKLPSVDSGPESKEVTHVDGTSVTLPSI